MESRDYCDVMFDHEFDTLLTLLYICRLKAVSYILVNFINVWHFLFFVGVGSVPWYS